MVLCVVLCIASANSTQVQQNIGLIATISLNTPVNLPKKRGKRINFHFHSDLNLIKMRDEAILRGGIDQTLPRNVQH